MLQFTVRIHQAYCTCFKKNLSIMLLAELVLPFVFLVTMKFSIGENDGCVVITNPITVVVLPNQYAEFKCAVDPENGNNINVLLNNIDTSISANATEYLERGIFWDNYNNDMFNITIKGTSMNNGFSISCGFGSCYSDEAKIIVVNGPPASPDRPLITVINLTSLLISWSPPWPHPIDSYVLSYTSNITAEINVTLPSNTTQFVLRKSSESDCIVYSVKVLAVTDVGPSEFSNVTYTGFPKDFSNIAPVIGQSVNISQQFCNNTSTTTVIGTIPSVCEYESITYMFNIIDMVTDTSLNVIVPDISVPKAFFWPPTTTGLFYYNITQISTNKAGQEILFSSVFNNSTSITSVFYNGQVTQHPRTTVALVNSNATFTCHDDDTTGDFPISLEINQVLVTNQNPMKQQQYHDNGIYWSIIKDSQDKEIGFDIIINATIMNNGTTIECYFSNCISDEVSLIVVNSPPSPPEAPLVKASNTTLIITWSPSWPHPTEDYILFVRKSSTNQTFNYTVTEPNHELIQIDDNFSDCEVLYFSVLIDTEVGASERSDEISYGFIKGIQSVDVSQLTGSYNITTDNNGTVHLQISLQPFTLDICDYEMIRYQYTVINMRSNESLVVVNNESSLMTSIELNFPTIQNGDSMNVLLKITDDASQELNVILFENINVVIIEPTSSSSSSGIIIGTPTTTQSNFISSSSVRSSSTATSTLLPIIIIISSVISGVVLILLVVMVIIISAICIKLKNNEVVRNNSVVNYNADQVDFTLPRMIANDNYANPQEAMYDSIVALKELKPPTDHNIHSPISPMTPGIDAPLLPPRNIADTTPLRARRNLEPLTLKETDHEDDYISMSSNAITSNGTANRVIVSPRYTEAPGLSFLPLQPQDGIYAIPGPLAATLQGKN